MKLSELLKKFSSLENLNVICVKECRQTFEYKNGKPTANTIGYSFAVLDKELGQLSFFIPKEHLESDSLLQTAVNDCVRFGEIVDFTKLSLKLQDISISVFNGQLYLKCFLAPTGNLPSGVLENELEDFFHD